MPRYKLFRFKSLSSTQDKAREFAKKGLKDIVVVADVQTKGRGRFRRKWFSGKDGLWMSILLKPKNIQNVQYLTFAAAVAVVKAVKETLKLNTKIKWPNDVHYGRKKLCGILTEGIFGKDNYVILGIGLNVNQNKFSEEIREIATSLKIIKKSDSNIEDIRKNILEQFFTLYSSYYNKNKLKNILEIWKKYCDTINKNAAVITATKKLKGKVLGVDEECRLILRTKNNTAKIVEGDLKIRY